MAEYNANDGLQREDLEEALQMCGKNAGITLESFKELVIESGVPFSVGAFADKKAIEGIIGIYKFVLTGLDKEGQHCSIEVALKAKGSPEEIYMPLCKLYANAGKAEDVADFTMVSQNFEHCSDLEVMAAQLAMKEEQFARFLPKIYHTLHDVGRKQWAVFMEYLNPNDLVISGGFDMSVWNRDAYRVVLTELAKFHALYLGNLQYVGHHFGTILKHQPRRHLNKAAICQMILEYVSGMYSAFFTYEHSKIFANYFERLEKITEEIESFPLAFGHNDSHIGKSYKLRR